MTNDQKAAVQKLDALFGKMAQKQPGRQLISCIKSGCGSFEWSSAIGAENESSSAIGADNDCPSISGTPLKGTHINVNTPFFIASIDKLMNAVLLLQLCEQELAGLDEPVINYLPGSLIDGLHVYKGKDTTPEITVRHLLTHTSGLADWYEDFPKNGKNLVEDIIATGDRDLSLEEMMDYVRRELRPHFAPQPIVQFLNAEKSAKKDHSRARFARIKTRYTDTGFMLICAILTEITGLSLEQLHHSRIYEPLGMKHTWMTGRTSPAEPVSKPLPLLASGRQSDFPKLLRSVWGVYSICADMIAFLRELYNGKLFQKPETRELMFSGWHRFGFPSDRAAIRLPGWPIAYSHGVMHFKLPRLFTPFKPMPEIVGHTGSTGCWLFYCPEKDLYFAGAADDLTAGALPFKYVPEMLGKL